MPNGKKKKPKPNSLYNHINSYKFFISYEKYQYQGEGRKESKNLVN